VVGHELDNGQLHTLLVARFHTRITSRCLYMACREKIHRISAYGCDTTCKPVELEIYAVVFRYPVRVHSHVACRNQTDRTSGSEKNKGCNRCRKRIQEQYEDNA
jgi:hypothetical protein